MYIRFLTSNLIKYSLKNLRTCCGLSVGRRLRHGGQVWTISRNF
jgi:hypothetical protein